MTLFTSKRYRRRTAFTALLAFLACLFFGCVSMQLTMVKQATSAPAQMMSDHHDMQDAAEMCSPDQQQCNWKLQPLDTPQPDVSYVLLFWVTAIAAVLTSLLWQLRSLLYLYGPQYAECRRYPQSYPRLHRLQSVDLN